jgi:toxin ParE1/3/4
MMTRRLPVVLSQKALADLESIAAYILKHGGSERIANGFADRIKLRCAKIGNLPYGGRSRDDLWPGLRTVPFEHSAVITYVIEANAVRIINVFYGGRDFEQMIRGRNSDDDV